MPTEIRISKHNALYQASIQLEELDYTKLYRAYSGIRKSQIEPRVLFKVLVCAYMKGVYSSRKIEELCRENLVFRWLLEDQKTPDHCTIARFRGNRNLQEAFEDLFFQYVKKLENKGYTEHSEVFVDGTKIESKANRYTFVWLKQVSKQLEKIKARLKELVCPQGNLTSTKVEKRLEQLNTEIQRDKTINDNYYLLTLAAIAKEIRQRGLPPECSVRIAAGLPLTSFGRDKPKFKDYLLRSNQPLNYKFEGVEYSITIEEVAVFPQGYAALMTEVGLLQDEPSMLLMDLGGWTVDGVHHYYPIGKLRHEQRIATAGVDRCHQQCGVLG